MRLLILLLCFLIVALQLAIWRETRARALATATDLAELRETIDETARTLDAAQDALEECRRALPARPTQETKGAALAAGRAKR